MANLNIINASEGHYLTQSGDVDLRDRVFTTQLFLSVQDNADNWKEISIEDAEILQSELEEILRKEMEESSRKDYYVGE